MLPLRDQIASVIVEICRPEKPDLSDENKPLLECGLDSLDFASVLMALEDKFHVTIRDEDMEQLGTLREIVGYLEKRVSA